MKHFHSKPTFLLPVLLTAAALVTALALSSCSRSGVADSLTGPSHGSASGFASGPGKGGTPPPPPPPPPGTPPPAADPCVSLTGFGGSVVAVDAAVVQNRAARLRMEITGDVAAGTINKLGPCSSVASTVSFISGRGTVSGAGVSVNEAFGPLLQVPGEPGVLVADAPNGDVLEIIWPALAGDPPSPPILRLQLARPGQAGGRLNVTMTFTARTANGATATFTATGTNLLVPALR